MCIDNSHYLSIFDVGRLLKMSCDDVTSLLEKGKMEGIYRWGWCVHPEALKRFVVNKKALEKTNASK